MNTTALPWGIIICIAAAFIAASAQEWFTGQYELTRKGFRVTVTRRWYGTRAWVILRGHEDDDEPERYRVLEVDAGDVNPPWLKVVSLDFPDDAVPFWAPVTGFVPEAVRRLRPWIFRYRWLRLPVLFAYMPLPRPVRADGDGRAPAEINTAYYLNMASWKRPYDLPGTFARLIADNAGSRGRRLELMRVAATGQWALFRNLVRLDCSTDADLDALAARDWASATLGRVVEWENATDAPDERCGYWTAPLEAGA